MGRIIAALLLCMILGAAVFAQNEKDFIFDGKGTITGYKGRHTLIVIPKTEAEMEEFEDEKIIEPLYFINDANRVIEAFLKAGADPDMRGHPYPYSLEAIRARITDKEADEYFANGTRHARKDNKTNKS